jgi:(E)-4-hydroxy-3-methylbut-2-enyl-diphosphate synthase
MQTLPNPISSAPSTSADAPPAAFDTTIHRRKTRPVPVGDVIIGGGHPVVVQSMINEDTLDV